MQDETNDVLTIALSTLQCLAEENLVHCHKQQFHYPLCSDLQLSMVAGPVFSKAKVLAISLASCYASGVEEVVV